MLPNWILRMTEKTQKNRRNPKTRRTRMNLKTPSFPANCSIRYSKASCHPDRRALRGPPVRLRLALPVRLGHRNRVPVQEC